MSKFNDLLSSVLGQGIMGIDILNIIIFSLVFIFSLVVMGFYNKIVIKKLKKIVENNKLSFAFPCHSVYLEKK